MSAVDQAHVAALQDALRQAQAEGDAAAEQRIAAKLDGLLAPVRAAEQVRDAAIAAVVAKPSPYRPAGLRRSPQDDLDAAVAAGLAATKGRTP